MTDHALLCDIRDELRAIRGLLKIMLVSQERVTAAPPTDAPDTTSTAAVTVIVDAPAHATARPEQSSDHVAAAVQQRTPAGRFAPRVIPPTP